MFGQGYMQTAPSFSMLNFTSAPYTPEGNDRAYAHANGNYQAPYFTIVYTDPIPLLNSSLGFLPNHIYQNTPCFNPYGQPEADDFGYETPPQFPFSPLPIDMMPAQVTAERGADPNNLINQLTTILWESFGIESKGRARVYHKHTPITMTNCLTLKAIESLSFLSLAGRMVKSY
jgi:hypothetical protein